MPTLPDGQARFRAIISQGPEAFDEALFLGSKQRALLGLAVHANTISHARLVALEDSFPRCRAFVGEAEFNRLSRAFIEQGITGRPNQVGHRLPDWLADAGAEQCAVELAAFDLLWLESYHAAEAEAVTLASLAGRKPEQIMHLRFAPHPAARAFRPRVPIATALGLDDPRFDAARSLLIARPDAEPHIHPLDVPMTALWDILRTGVALGDGIAYALEGYPDTEALALVTGLIGTGALTLDVEEGNR